MIKLKGAKVSDVYDTGEIEALRIYEKNILRIGENEFIPMYDLDDTRKKDLPSIKLFKNGNIKSLLLQKESKISIKNKDFYIEKIVFHEKGSIKRIFPLDGRISAYWLEEDERNLAKEYDFKFSFAEFHKKVISICFYETQEIKSITLWPREVIDIKHKDKTIKGRVGISLYKNGNIESCEPNYPTKIKTPIGDIYAYDKNAVGIHGESNSLKFYENGDIKSLITSTNIIKVTNKEGKEIIHSSKVKKTFYNDDIPTTITVKIDFIEGKIVIDDEFEYSTDNNTFKIDYFQGRTLMFF